MITEFCIPINEGLVALGVGISAFAWTVIQHFQHKDHSKHINLWRSEEEQYKEIGKK